MKNPAHVRPDNFFTGGAEGDRTPDLLNAIQALSQLSYSPTAFDFYSISNPGIFQGANEYTRH